MLLLIFPGINTYRELQLALFPQHHPCPFLYGILCHPYERLLYKESMQLKKMI